MNRLKELRESRKELQSEVAERIGVSRQAYGLYETGKRQPDLETLNKMADYFEVTVDYLLGRNILTTYNSTTPLPSKILTIQQKPHMETLRKLRKERGLRQIDVANVLGITVSAYGNYELEQRKPNIDILNKLANFFGVTVDYLLGRESVTIQSKFTMNRIRILRKAKKVSMKTLGVQIGVSESTISLYENGKRQPDLQTLSRLADYFEVSIDYLTGRTASPKSEMPSSLITISEKYPDIIEVLNKGVDILTQKDIQEIVKFIEFIKFNKK